MINVNLDGESLLIIKNALSSGIYGSIDDVVTEALILLQEKNIKLEHLKMHLLQGAEQASRGEFVDDFSIDKLLLDLDAGQ
ncbi:MAG TPA: type II toxin-antitoxin system ParD family antitoxin [Cellvibrio sp.]